MNRIVKPFIVFVLVLLLVNIVVTPAISQTTPVNKSTGIANQHTENNSGVTYEITVPWEQLSLEAVTANGSGFIQVTLPGWSNTAQPGAPGLPMATELIGIPFGANIELRIIPGKSHTQKLKSPVLPASTQKSDIESYIANDAEVIPDTVITIVADPAVYNQSNDYPGTLAMVANDGVVREQRIISVATYPVQYNPKSNTLTVYESLQVEVLFLDSPALSRMSSSRESSAFENIFSQQILNYETARQWRQSYELPSYELEGGIQAESDMELNGAPLPWGPPDPGWRIKVQSEGLYRLSYSDLQAAGVLTANPDPQTFKLFNLGEEVSIYVEDEADGVFDANDYILFYGQGIDSKYTLDNIYWLTYGAGTGSRMQTRPGTPDLGATPAYYPASRKYETDLTYVPLAPGDENLERWLWSRVIATNSTPASLNYILNLGTTPDPTQSASVTVSMLGFTSTVSSQDHHVRLYMNNVLLDQVWWDGVAWQEATMTIAPGILVAGDNTLKVECVNDTGAVVDQVYIDWIMLNFDSSFQAESNVRGFSFDLSGTWKFEATGFTSADLYVYDITNPATPVQITGISVIPTGSLYKAQFEETISASTDYWVTASTAYRTVTAIEKDTASNLRSTTLNGADHIVITHKDFMTSANELRDYRSLQNLRAMSIDIQDIYDEFNYGIVGASPIQDFLAYTAANWVSPAPSFVVLMGDGHYNPNNYRPGVLGFGRVNYIPAYLQYVDPWMGETSSDNRYVTFGTIDVFPDMMIGRLSVNTADEAAAMVSKIKIYENQRGDWQKRVLAIADNADTGGNFAQISNDLIADVLPLTHTATVVNYGITHTTPTSARTAIQDAINAGAFIVNYIGHASYTAWASESLFTTADVPTSYLSNGVMQPVILAMTCYEGYFIRPHLYSSNFEALGEVDTRVAGKGAIASFSATGLGVANGHDFLDRGFMEGMLSNGLLTVGESVIAGKANLWATGNNLDLIDTYMLFGDPALRNPISPTAVDLLDFTATSAKRTVTLTWETVSEMDNLGFNLYRATSIDGPMSRITTELIPAQDSGSPNGAAYSFIDSGIDLKGGLKVKKTYYYWLEDIDIYGATELHGPVEVLISSK